MKVTYFKIQTLLNLLVSSDDQNEIIRLHKILREECHTHFIRFEVFYNREYYEEKIVESHRLIKEHIIRREYELAALKRDSRLLYEFKLREVEKHFNGQPPPAVVVDSNGLVRCLFSQIKNEKLIQLITTLSQKNF